MPFLPSQGDVCLIDLNPTTGHEQRGLRPALVVSVDQFNHGPAELAIVMPMTTRDRGIPLHVPVEPPEAGVRQSSFVMCEAVRSVSRQRFVERWGSVSRDTLREALMRLRVLTRPR